MNCYTHQANPAVALCHSCHKGLCSECQKTVSGVSSCSQCEPRVAKIIALVNANSRLFEASSSGAIPDSELTIYKKNQKIASSWCVALGLLTLFFVLSFLQSLNKPQSDAQYLWLAALSGMFLYSSITALNTWRRLVQAREAAISIIKAR